MLDFTIRTELSEVLSEHFSDSHISIGVKSNGITIMQPYAMIDMTEKAVFADLDTNFVGFLGKRLVVLGKLDNDLTFGVYKNSKLLYEFNANYKGFRSALSSFLKNFVEQKYIDAQERENKLAKAENRQAKLIQTSDQVKAENLKELKQNIDTSDLLSVFGNVATSNLLKVYGNMSVIKWTEENEQLSIENAIEVE